MCPCLLSPTLTYSKSRYTQHPARQTGLSFEVAPDLDPDQCSASTRRFIRPSLRDCNNKHREPCGRIGPKPIPKRVNSISSGPNPYLKLLEPVESRVEVYAALSYRWGGSQAFVPTSALLDTMKSEILWDDLSALHRDAIEMAQRFEIEYIWIDALCILQDSKDGWEVESARMGDYYGNAHVTILADMCRNLTISFLSPPSRALDGAEFQAARR